MGLAPSEAWRLTPRELGIHMEGWQKGRDWQNTVLAHFTASLINFLGAPRGRRLRARDLYKPHKSPALVQAEKARLQKTFEEAAKLLGPDRRPISIKRR